MKPMTMRWRLLLPGLALLLAACAPMHQQALTAEHRNQVKEVKVQMVVPQETFIFSAANPNISAAMGGGLIPALIDSAVQKSRQEQLGARVRPLLDKLIEVDFRDEARTVLAQEAGLPFRVSSSEVVVQLPGRKQHEAMISGLRPGQAYLRIVSFYSLDPEVLLLSVRSQAVMWRQGVQEKVFGTGAVYQSQVQSTEPEAVRERLREGVAQTLRLLALDMAQPAVQGQQGKAEHPYKTDAKSIMLQGDVLANEPARVLMRERSGTMFSLQK